MANFNREADPSCIFCLKNNNRPAPMETFSHIFYDCPEVGKVISLFLSKYLNIELTRDEFFNGNTEGTTRDRIAVNLILDLLRYSVWQTRLLKNRLSFLTIEYETINLLDSITGSSNKLKYTIMQCPFINVDGHRPRQFGRGP